LASQAALIEDSGLDGIWMAERLPIPGRGNLDFPDPLLELLICANATTALELGTCIYALPLRNKYEAARDFYTLQTLAPGRFSFGIGTGSQPVAYEAVGFEWESRFTRLADHMAGVRALFEDNTARASAGEPGEVPSWGSIVGRPRFYLGSWHSEAQLRRAVNEYDGWMASASAGSHQGGWRKVLTEGIRRYRDLGGRRAILSTTAFDLTKPDTPLDEDGPFTLICGPQAAAERLSIAEELGFDDVLLLRAPLPDGNHQPLYLRHQAYTTEELEQLRSLVAKDTRDYRLP
jgi:alkanesulfonate monooxygenase SsuD/methylene tetrahydromethanopterin reductase-like flavin-dependent oxidoreductase (luciferase family)